jgi:hypothetical protein
LIEQKARLARRFYMHACNKWLDEGGTTPLAGRIANEWSHVLGDDMVGIINNDIHDIYPYIAACIGAMGIDV